MQAPEGFCIKYFFKNTKGTLVLSIWRIWRGQLCNILEENRCEINKEDYPEAETIKLLFRFLNEAGSKTSRILR